MDVERLKKELCLQMNILTVSQKIFGKSGFLEFNGTEILTGPGKISAEQAKLYAETEFEKYRIIQDRLFMSDYDKFSIKLEEQTKSLSED